MNLPGLNLPRTQRQKEILEYIVRFADRHGYYPSYAQIARHFGIKSRATIAKHVAALKRQGLIDTSLESGSFVFTVKGDAICEVKVLSTIAAGHPLDVVDCDEKITIPSFLIGRVRPERIYALRVKGDSMMDEHICDGDIALIEYRTEAHDGEIVVALLVDEDRATLKKLYRRGPNVELRPANAQYEPLTLPASKVEVRGVYRGLIRPASQN